MAQQSEEQPPMQERDDAPPDNKEEGPQRETRGGEKDEREEEPNALERLVSWTSALLLLAAIGYLTWEGLKEREPPVFEAGIERVWTADEHYYVRLIVHNHGGESVQALRFAVRLTEDGRTVTEAEGGLSWLPAHSSRRTVVILDKDPRRYDVVFTPFRYELP